MSAVVIEKGYKKKAMCRELVIKAGGQRPRSIIVKINREKLKTGQRRETED